MRTWEGDRIAASWFNGRLAIKEEDWPRYEELVGKEYRIHYSIPTELKKERSPCHQDPIRRVVSPRR